MTPKLKNWLKTQPQQFIDDVVNNEVLGDENFTLDKLRELDSYFNPEIHIPEDKND